MQHSPTGLPTQADQRAVASTRVLLVDDSRMQRKILSAYIRRWGFDVTEAADGQEALDLCRAEQFNLIVSDWQMPGLSGLDFCKAFRALRGKRYGYFILLTSKDDPLDMIQGLEQGADDFLTKPVGANELRARLRAGERVIRMEQELTHQNGLLNTALTALQDLHAETERDLKEARALQQSLVPDRPHTYSRTRVSLLLEPCGQIGGDLVGSFRVSETEIGVYGIDVSGHGVASALLGARISSFLQSARPDLNVAVEQDAEGLFTMLDPAEVCARMNKLLLEEMETDLYFTMLLVRIDLRAGLVRVAQAGHPGLMLVHKDGTIETPGHGGFPIGLLPEAVYHSFDLPLRSGDRLLIYSDGFPDTTDGSGRLLEDEGMLRLVQKNISSKGQKFLSGLVGDLRAYSGGARIGDDLSAALVEYYG